MSMSEASVEGIARKRNLLPFRYAWKATAKFLAIGVVGFGAVALAVTDLPVLGYIVAGVVTFGLLVLFVRHFTPNS